jgi:phosphoglycerate dehydrogenase-like enzyme
LYVSDPPPHVTELHPPTALHELLPRADFVVLATPGMGKEKSVLAPFSSCKGDHLPRQA